MKRFLCLFLVFFTLSSCSSQKDRENAASVSPKASAGEQMTVTSSGIIDGVIADEYGQYGSQISSGIPTRSLPLSITNAPEGTVCFALIMTDSDSKPLCGFEWTHWTAVNITQTEVPADASMEGLSSVFQQGINDFGTIGYGGPTPPDKPHTYVISIYALNSTLDLKESFDKNALLTAMNGHVLASAQISGTYRK